VSEPVLSVRHLDVRFVTDAAEVHAVDGVSFDVLENEVVGVVGESGSGKSVSMLAVLGLLPPNAQVTGEVRFRGRDVLALGDEERRQLRGAHLAMVFQDALAALNPVMRVGHQVGEAISVHHELPRKEVEERVLHLLDLVGIPNPRERARQYPHEYSGGMRQRAMIAMAIANEPDVLVADEPTTALDVTIQAQVLDVLERIQDRTSSSIVLITHDLGVVAGLADRVVVMYAGKQVEAGSVDDLFYRSRHPYTLGLLASLPRVDEGATAARARLHAIRGQPPSLVHVPTGCAFHPRCPYAHLPHPCAVEVPELLEAGSPGHRSACHYRDDMAGDEARAVATGAGG
jgi:oligopeptide/dipeptide ABC transporter ATP-binding protein